LELDGFYEKFYKGRFYREVGIRENDRFSRFVVRNKVQFYRFLRANRSENKDVYAGLYDVPSINSMVIDRIMLDVDWHDGSINTQLEMSYRYMRKVADRLDDVGIEYMLFFTGRGYHFYIDFEPVHINNVGDALLGFVQMLGIEEYVDKKVFDIRRLARVPFTYNTATGLMMVPVRKNMELEEIVRRARSSNVFETIDLPDNDWIADVLKQLDVAKTVSGDVKDRVPFFKKYREYRWFPRCVRNALNQLLVTGELDHYQRLFLAWFLLRIYPVEEVEKIFRLAKDYKPYYTRYQLEYIKSRKHKIYKCARIKDELGLCPYQNMHECPFYPWLEAWLPRWEDAPVQ